MASQGQPSKNAPSGPLLVHFLHPMQRKGSTSIWPNGGWSSSGTQNMQSNTGQYGTQAGEPAQPVQHSVMTAISFGFFFRGVSIPSDFGSHFSSVAMVSSGSIHPPWATSSFFSGLPFSEVGWTSEPKRCGNIAQLRQGWSMLPAYVQWIQSIGAGASNESCGTPCACRRGWDCHRSLSSIDSPNDS